MLDNLTEDYVRTARAKGASERRVLIRHVLRDSLIPIATLLGLSLPGFLACALITESVFNYPGMGIRARRIRAQAGLSDTSGLYRGGGAGNSGRDRIGSAWDVAYAALGPAS